MNNECEKRGGCRNEKNSVDCPYKDGDIMPSKNRDYKAEYAREKARGGKNAVHFSVNMTKEKKAAFDAKVELEPANESGKYPTKNSLINKWIDMYLAGELD